MVIETQTRRPIGQAHSNGNGHKAGEFAGEFIIKRAPLTLSLEAEAAKRVDIVGGEGASLAKLRSTPGINVPEAFVITTELQRQILEQNPEIKERIRRLDEVSERWIEAKLSGGSDEFTWGTQAQAAGEMIKAEIEDVRLPSPTEGEIIQMYDELGKKAGKRDVAVHRLLLKSSAVAQDGLGSSFTGELGREQVVNEVIKCLALQFGEEAVAYRNQARLNAVQEALEENPENINSALKRSESLSHTNAKLAVVVQEMIFARGGFGLSVGHNGSNGSSFVLLNVGSDSWDVDTSGKIKDRNIVNKKRKTLFNGHGREDLPLSDEEVVKIANDVFTIRKAFDSEVHVEFMSHKGNILFVQAKPV